jgi:hypothetical protein
MTTEQKRLVYDVVDHSGRVCSTIQALVLANEELMVRRVIQSTRIEVYEEAFGPCRLVEREEAPLRARSWGDEHEKREAGR